MPAPCPSDPPRVVECAALVGMLLALVVTSMYFIHGPGLVLTRINQTERITVECKAGPAAGTAVPPSLGPPWLVMAETIIGGLCACALLGFLTLGWSADLESRLKKLEARLEQQGKHDAATRESIMRLLEPTARQ